MPSPTGPGKPLPEAIRQKMERAFGQDFQDVRLHLGGKAAMAGAVAFARRSAIHLSANRFNPVSQRGQRLLGHELAHVVQQRQGRVGSPAGGSPIVEDSGLEAEAESAGVRAAQGQSAPLEAAGRTAPALSISQAPVQRVIQEANTNAGIYFYDDQDPEQRHFDTREAAQKYAEEHREKWPAADPESEAFDRFYETDSSDDDSDPEHVGVEIHEERKGGTAEFDGVRVRRAKIYEDKRGNPIQLPHPKAFSKEFNRPLGEVSEDQRAGSWAQKQIYEKTVNKINRLQTATKAAAPRSSGRPVPSIAELRNSSRFKFRIESEHPAVKDAVRTQVQRLRSEHRNWTFTTKFNAPPAKTLPEDDQGSRFYTPSKRSRSGPGPVSGGSHAPPPVVMLPPPSQSAAAQPDESLERREPPPPSEKDDAAARGPGDESRPRKRKGE